MAADLSIVPDELKPDDGNGDDDAYNRGWNACRDFVLAKPTQPAATQEAVAWQYRVDIHRDGNWSDWRPCTENFHDEIIEFGECVEGDDPRGVIADARPLFAAPVSPSREVEALERDAARYRFLRSAYVGEDGYLHPSQWDIVAQERSRGTLLYGDSLDRAIDSKLAPVQEK